MYYYQFPNRERKKEIEIPHPYKPNSQILDSSNKKKSQPDKNTLTITTPTVDPTSDHLLIFMTIINFYLLDVINIPGRLLPSNQNYCYLLWVNQRDDDD